MPRHCFHTNIINNRALSEEVQRHMTRRNKFLVGLQIEDSFQCLVHPVADRISFLKRPQTKSLAIFRRFHSKLGCSRHFFSESANFSQNQRAHHTKSLQSGKFQTFSLEVGMFPCVFALNRQTSARISFLKRLQTKSLASFRRFHLNLACSRHFHSEAANFSVLRPFHTKSLENGKLQTFSLKLGMLRASSLRAGKLQPKSAFLDSFKPNRLKLARLRCFHSNLACSRHFHSESANFS